MNLTEAEMAAINAQHERETPMVAALAEETLAKFRPLSDLGRRRVLISVMAAWMAGEMDGEDEAAVALLDDIYENVKGYLPGYCEFYRTNAPRRAM